MPEAEQEVTVEQEEVKTPTGDEKKALNKVDIDFPPSVILSLPTFSDDLGNKVTKLVAFDGHTGKAYCLIEDAERLRMSETEEKAMQQVFISAQRQMMLAQGINPPGGRGPSLIVPGGR